MSHANPGVHHIRLGDAVVTALNDGQFDADIGWVTGLPAVEAEAVLREGFRVLPPRITVSCFLLRTDKRTIMVDTGAGTGFGHVLGAAKRRLASVGVTPESVDAILLTHAHGDHVGGLLDDAGDAAFPKAELIISGAETTYWLDKEIQAKAPAHAQGGFETAQKCLAPYAKRTRRIHHGGEVLPGITAFELPGHTPGHTGWIVASGGATLFIWADVVHLPGLQFAHPEAGLAFDVDGAQGQVSRKRALDFAATDRLLVAGMHLDFPTFGHVRRVGSAYAFEPLVWAPTHEGLFSPS